MLLCPPRREEPVGWPDSTMLSFEWIRWLNLLMTGKLTVVLAMALVFAQLQCAAWCTVSLCDLGQVSEGGSHNVPPCHRHRTDSSKNLPASSCSHGVVIVSVASFSTAQAPVAVPLAATLSVQPEFARALSGNDSAVLIASPPGAGDPFPLVLRI
jgi:hypothetical protein